MEHLLKGLSHFQHEVFEKKRSLFQGLAKEQHPRVLFITCSDSRVDPSVITQSDLGDLFVLRNAGNMIPPHGANMGIGQEATIDYALHHLHIEHIIVCGHTHCGAMDALINTPESELSQPVRQWLGCAEAVRAIVNQHPELKGDDRLMKATQANVKLQLQHIATLPSVVAALDRQALHLHGWVYCLENAEVFALNNQGSFEPVVV